VHSRFWREAAKQRFREFGSFSVFDILTIKNAREIKLHLLEHLTNREDIPVSYKDKWHDIQAKKNNLSVLRENLTDETTSLPKRSLMCK